MSGGFGGLQDLYGEVILDHNRRPRHYGPLATANRRAHGANPLCGDKLTVAVELNGNRISNIRFEGSGCAISKASASLMSEAVSGRTVPEVLDLFAHFHNVLTSPPDQEVETGNLGKLAATRGELAARYRHAAQRVCVLERHAQVRQDNAMRPR